MKIRENYDEARKKNIPNTVDTLPFELVKAGKKISNYWIMSKARHWAICCNCSKDCKTKKITLVKK